MTESADFNPVSKQKGQVRFVFLVTNSIIILSFINYFSSSMIMIEFEKFQYSKEGVEGDILILHTQLLYPIIIKKYPPPFPFVKCEVLSLWCALVCLALIIIWLGFNKYNSICHLPYFPFLVILFVKYLYSKSICLSVHILFWIEAHNHPPTHS